MELELLNDQLRKGQATVESEAASAVEAARLAKQEHCRAEQRLHSLPKRFTESLQMLREEVEGLEKEKLDLELARQSKYLEVIAQHYFHPQNKHRTTNNVTSEFLLYCILQTEAFLSQLDFISISFSAPTTHVTFRCNRSRKNSTAMTGRHF